MLMNTRKWVLLYIVAIPLGILALQFILLKQYDIYALSANSYRYDFGCWVKKPPRVVIMGTSMARHGIIPEVISTVNGLHRDDVVNVSNNAATPWQLYNTYMRNEQMLSSAEVVFFTLDPWLFSSRYYRHSQYERVLWNYDQWRRFARDEGVANNYFFPLRLIQYNLQVRTCKERRAVRNGFKPMKEATEPVRKKDQSHWYASEGFGISDFEVAHLKLLKERVEANGGRFVFVQTPKHRLWHEETSQYGPFLGELAERVRDAIGVVESVGTYDATRYKLSEDDFYDFSHTSASGALKFTLAEFSNLGRFLGEKPGRGSGGGGQVNAEGAAFAGSGG